MGDTVRLENWRFNQLSDEGVIFLGGTCYGHNKLADGTRIHTSRLVDVVYNKDKKALLCETLNTVYELKIDSISFDEPVTMFEDDVNVEIIGLGGIGSTCLVQQKLGEYYTELFNNYVEDELYNQVDYKCNIDEYRVEEIVGHLQDDLGVLGEIEKAFRARVENVMGRLDIEEGDLYVKMSSSNINYAVLAAMKINGDVCLADIKTHTGMFVDSVIVQNRGVFDFRYYIRSGKIETYHISDGIKTITVENVGKSKVVLEIEGYDHEIESSEVKVIKIEEGTSSGLISPDCVNGKNMFNDGSNE